LFLFPVNLAASSIHRYKCHFRVYSNIATLCCFYSHTMEYDVKKALKDAKEFIKNKEYTSALDTCKVK